MMLLLTSNLVRKKRGEDKNADMKRATTERTNAWKFIQIGIDSFTRIVFLCWQIPWLMLKIKFKLNFFRNVYLRGWNLGWCWMNNEDESVHCDQDNGERREEDAAGLGGPDQLAEVLHVLAQGPILQECDISRLRAKKLLQFCILHTVQYWFWCNRSSEYWSDAVGNHLLSHLC